MELRKRIVQGGAFLVGRQAIGVAIGFGGVLALTRIIGPSEYGLYAGALAIILFLQNVGRFGLDVYLLRRHTGEDPLIYNLAFTYLLMVGCILALVGTGAVHLGLTNFIDTRYGAPLLGLLPTLPLTLIAVPMTTMLERSLDYRRVAIIELTSQTGFYLVAIPLALLDYGLWAPVLGYWAWQGILVGTSFSVSGYRPRATWSVPHLKDMLSYGVGYSSASWLWQLRSLVNPIIVGSILGPASVAHVNLAIRLVELLSMVKTVLWRVSLSVLGRVQDDLVKLRKVVTEGMWVQVVAVGIPLAGFSMLATWFIPLMFGEDWTPVAEVFPFIALSYLVNALFNMHSSVLYVFRENGKVAVFHLIHVGLFATFAVILVPRYDLVGYGLAEIFAFPSYLVVHRALAQQIHVSYRDVFPWLIVLGTATMGAMVPWPWVTFLWLPVVGVALMPRQVSIIKQYVSMLTSNKLSITSGS